MTNKDLFDESTMSFGEHLEALRYHLIMALLGLTITVIVMLIFSGPVIRVIQVPVQSALRNAWRRYENPQDPSAKQNPVFRTWRDLWYNSVDKPILAPTETQPPPKEQTIVAEIDPRDLLEVLHQLNPQFPSHVENLPTKPIPLRIPMSALPKTAEGASLADRTLGMTTTLSVEEGFLVYMKVALISGFILASPWIFYQLWLFVAAGLYPTERQYIYTYLPISLGLFLFGALFCFAIVLPYVLDFLFDFNIWLKIMPQSRITEYLNFAMMLPLMFGLSFQLPLVMLFLERINLLQVKDYRDKRRMAILVMAFISMVLTPSDPVSMMLMLIPLCVLYELGIWMCLLQNPRPSFD